MQGWDWLATILLGYATVPLVSLASRKHWPQELKFIVAFALSVGVAVLQVWARGDALNPKAIEAAFGVVFAAQQVTWSLELPGAGTPSVNEALLKIGDGE